MSTSRTEKVPQVVTDREWSRDLFISGNRMYLRGLTERDLEGDWYRWFNDVEVTYFQDKGYFPNTLEKQTVYYETIKNSNSDVVLAIIDATTDKHIGNVGLHQISWIHRTAELGIVIGEKEFWGKGFGKQAWRLITQYGFETLNLHKIYATVLTGNQPSLACAFASGYKIEGTQEEQIYKHGRYFDLILVGLTRSSWFDSKVEDQSNRPSSQESVTPK